MARKQRACVQGGKGAVGSALVEVLSSAHEVTVGDPAVRVGCKAEFLHVAFPYTDEFVERVQYAAQSHEARYVIIHSTVPMGTTRKVGANALHSPVRGQHDNLPSSLRRFVKYLGAVEPSSVAEVSEHLALAGIPVAVWPSPEATEFLKLLCSARYLNDLAYYQWAEKVMQERGIDPRLLLDWTVSYNAGYAGTRYERPDLEFPQGKIGGACVLQNSRLLQKDLKSDFLARALSEFDNA